MQVIDWKIYKLKSLNFRILICSLLACLSFLLDIFFHLPFLASFNIGFVKINLSLIFVFPIFYYSGPIFGILILLLQFLMTSFFDLTYGGDKIAGLYALFLAHFIKFISNLITILFMYIFSKTIYYLHLENHNHKLFIVFLLTIIFSSFINALLNTFFYLPFYFYLTTNGSFLEKFIIDYPTYNVMKWNFINKINFKNDYIGLIKNLKLFLNNNIFTIVFIPNFLGNLVKLSFIYLIYFPLAKIFRKFN